MTFFLICAIASSLVVLSHSKSLINIEQNVKGSGSLKGSTVGSATATGSATGSTSAASNSEASLTICKHGSGNGGDNCATGSASASAHGQGAGATGSTASEVDIEGSGGGEGLSDGKENEFPFDHHEYIGLGGNNKLGGADASGIGLVHVAGETLAISVGDKSAPLKGSLAASTNTKGDGSAHVGQDWNLAVAGGDGPGSTPDSVTGSGSGNTSAENANISNISIGPGSGALVVSSPLGKRKPLGKPATITKPRRTKLCLFTNFCLPLGKK